MKYIDYIEESMRQDTLEKGVYLPNEEEPLDLERFLFEDGRNEHDLRPYDRREIY